MTEIHTLIIEAIDDTTAAFRATAVDNGVSAALEEGVRHRLEAPRALERVASGEQVDQRLIATASPSLTE